MKKDKSARRNFLKMATLGLGGLSIYPSLGTAKRESALMGNSLPSDKKLNILCIGAHPGDPEFGCGGTMAKYSDAGHSVTFLYLTRGEAGDPTKSYATSAALRTKEAETACKLLKVKPMFAGQIDANTVLSKEKNDEMSGLIMSENPDLVFTHWPLDAHPDHQVSGLLALTAWVRSNRTYELYFYEVNTGSETMAFSPTDYVDITSVRDKKKAAMFAHKTQFPQDVYDNYFRTMEEFRGLEAGVKAAEGFIHFKGKIEKAAIIGLQD
jgi:LmbE family N-acetylglucosaminyl deacetylase